MDIGNFYSSESTKNLESYNCNMMKYGDADSTKTTDLEVDSTKSSNDDQVVHQGWLNKRGEYIHNWRKRYFFLMKNGLFLGFRNKPVSSKNISDPDNNFTIRNCTIFLDNKPKSYTFTIRLSHGTTMIERIFSVDSEQERLKWTTLIKEVKLNLNKSGIPKRMEEDFIGCTIMEKKCNMTNGKQKLSRKKSKITFEKFEFLKVLGKGTYGKVILCRERATINFYAIKIIKKEIVLLNNENIRLILAEKRVLQHINHPFLLNLKYSFTTFGHLCLVTEFVSGGELYFHLSKECPFNEDRARFYGAEIVCALEYLHTNAIIHRDLKLENILLDRDGHIRIIDFGMCKENIHWNSETSSICGTPEYRAPETIVHDVYGKVVDWWAFGIIMCEMLVGKNPFYDNDRDVMFENVLEVNITFPRWISYSSRDLLSGLLNKEPSNRLGSGQEGTNLIQNHPFFDSIDWELLILKQIVPPFKPVVLEEDDTRNFDVQFTGESVQLTPPHADELDGVDTQYSDDQMIPSEANFHRQLLKQFSYQS